MKKCILMFALLIVALLTAVIMEKRSGITPVDNLVAGEPSIENTLIGQNK